MRREEKISEGGFLRKEIFIPIRFSARAALQRKKICSPDESLLQLTFSGMLIIAHARISFTMKRIDESAQEQVI